MRSNGRAGACTLGGRVGDADGHPLRATITLTDAHGAQLDHGTSDRDGTFTLRGRPGPALLIVSAPGFRPSADMTTLAPGDARVTVVLEARERAVSQS